MNGSCSMLLTDEKLPVDDVLMKSDTFSNLRGNVIKLNIFIWDLIKCLNLNNFFNKFLKIENRN